MRDVAWSSPQRCWGLKSHMDLHSSHTCDHLCFVWHLRGGKYEHKDAK